jgi:predicted amino acid dehydrogenase
MFDNSAAIVDDLLCRPSPHGETFISFFFCKENNAETLQATTILGSLLHACLTVDKLTAELEDVIAQLFVNGMPDGHDFAAVFAQVSNLARFHYIVIDGFDACPMRERAILVNVLQQVSTSAQSSVRLFFSSRPDVEDEIRRAFPTCHRQTVSQAHADRDISTFVAESIRAKIDDGDLAVGDPALATDICDALSDGADGMCVSSSH